MKRTFVLLGIALVWVAGRWEGVKGQSSVGSWLLFLAGAFLVGIGFARREKLCR